jgi:hypothetical protein
MVIYRTIIYLNAHCERFVRSIKLSHYHAERNHQGLANQLMAPEPDLGSQTDQVRRRERLGGVLSYYDHDAA